MPATALVTFTVTLQELLTATVPPVRETIPDPAVAVAVPPQVLVRPLGVATTRLAGKLSVKATPASATVFAAGLVMVMVNVLNPFTGIPVGLNTLTIAGGATTVTVAVLLVAPVPPSVEVIAPVVLFIVPAAVPVTFTERVQLVPAAMAPAVRLTVTEPAVAVGTPPQVLANPLGVATTKPAGKLSVKATPVSAVVPFGLLIVNVSEVVPLSGMLAAPNALLMVGGDTTVRVAVLLVAPGPLSFEEIAPVVLFLTPPVVPVTFTVNVHEVFVAKVTPIRLTTPEPEVAVAVPPQVLVKPLGVATTSPAGRLSVNEIPVRVRLPAGLAIVKVSEVEPLNGMAAAPKALVIVGGAATNKWAEAVLPVPPLVEVTAPVTLV